MVTRIYDRPDSSLGLETFINVEDPDQRGDYAALAEGRSPATIRSGTARNSETGRAAVTQEQHRNSVTVHAGGGVGAPLRTVGKQVVADVPGDS